jgi:N-acetyl-anhydromuramyl-L-alanine amidase AmpD
MKAEKFIVLMLAIVMLTACSGRLQEEAVAKGGTENPEIPQSVPQLPVIKDFMPKMNFVPRGEAKTHVMLHFISNAAQKPENPYVYEDIRNIFVEYEIAPHYMIDRTGKIYFLMPENRSARHAGKGKLMDFPEYNDRLNDYSIGIELMAIGTEVEMQQMMSKEQYMKIQQEHIAYTEAQYQALNLLLDDILSRNKKIKKDRIHIVGHDEYAPDRKTDPGSLFQWGKIIPTIEY